MAYEAEKDKRVNETSRTQRANSSGSKPVITVDYERYAHMLDDSDLSEAQKREFLQALWNIIVEFVSLGFGVHPLQQAQNPCGKDKKNSLRPALTTPDQLYLDHKLLLENFDCAADIKEDGRTEGVES